MNNSEVMSNYIKTYSDKTYKHPTMVRHKGTVIAFAMDSERKIYYTVLDLSEQEEKGPLDVNCWLDNPEELAFPNEIVQVGYGIVPPTTMPVVKKGSHEEVSPGSLSEEEKDLFLSTTARLTADAPFQVLSDGRYVYLFRQSIAKDHSDMVHTSDGVHLVDRTLLLDRFVFVGTELQPKMEVRYRRSRRKDWPDSDKDSLGAKDMDEKPFYEPTQELDFVRNLTDGRFSVLLLPTQIADVQRWQIFAHNSQTEMIDSLNVERSEDGLFNTRGTQFYTCADHPDVFELRPGTCSEPSLDDQTQPCGKDLIPIISREGYAEWALAFDGVDDYITFSQKVALGATYTVEGWFRSFSKTVQSIFGAVKSGGNHYLLIELQRDGRLRYLHRVPAKGARGQDIFSEGKNYADGEWHHFAAVKDHQTMALYVDGELIGTAQDDKPIPDETDIAIGRLSPTNSARYFKGHLDDVRIWDRAREQWEIEESRHHRLVGNEPGLVGYWRFDEGSGNRVKDQTEHANHGQLHVGSGDSIDSKWVPSDAPIGDHPGIRRTSFSFADRTVVSGLSALLYYQQEMASASYEAQPKPFKKNARVMLAVPTQGDDRQKNEIAVLDFAVSREGKLAQVPDNLILERIAGPSDESLARISQLEEEARTLQTKLDKLDIGTRYLEYRSTLRHCAELEDDMSWGRNRKWQLAYGMYRSFHILEERPQITNWEDGKWHSTWFSAYGEWESYSMTKSGPDPNYGWPGWNQFRNDYGKYCEPTTDDPPPECTVTEPDDWQLVWPDHPVLLWWRRKLGEEFYRVEQQLRNKQLEIESERGDSSVPFDDLLPQISTLEERIEQLNKGIDYWWHQQKLWFGKWMEDPQYEDEFNSAQQHYNEKVTERNTAQTELDNLRSIVQDDVPIHMQLLHVDPFGLTVDGGVLGPAWTTDPPLLFDSATGMLGLYFRGTSDQFFVAYYDTNTARAQYRLAADTGAITLVARSAGPAMDDASITVTDGPDAHTCTVTIASPTTDITETWGKVPRAAQEFAAVLNGAANEGPSYDYEAHAQTNRPTDHLQNGSLLFVVDASNASGPVQNGSAQRSGSTSTPACRWRADPPGNALRFDGQDDIVRLSDSAKLAQLDAAGDLTMEAWVKPDAIAGTSQVIRHRSSASRYRLELKTDSALAFDGVGDYITFSQKVALGATYTVEGWFRSSSKTVQSIFGAVKSGGNHYLLIELQRDGRLRYLHRVPAKGARGQDIFSEGKNYADGEWHHFAAVKDHQTMALYVDGELIGTAQDDKPIPDETDIAIGRLSPTNSARYFKGHLADVRIWNRARTPDEIQADMYRRLAGDEPGLAGYWHFEDGVARDYSGGDNHGVIHGDPQIAPSPLPIYILALAGVGDQLVQTTQAIPYGNWTHLAAVFNQSHALQFDGADDHLDCGHDITLDISRDLTLEVFLQVDDLSQPRGILTKGVLNDGTEQDVPYALYIDTEGKILFAFEDRDHRHHAFKSNDSIQAGQFHRIAVTRKHETETEEQKDNEGQLIGVEVKQWDDIRFYIDNSEAGYHRYEGTSAGSSNQPLEIGKSYGRPSQRWVGVDSADAKGKQILDIIKDEYGYSVGLLILEVDGSQPSYFDGIISEVRIWNTAREQQDVCSDIKGMEEGLVSWWRFEENEGHIAYDAKSNNHARLQGGPRWVKNPDPQGSTFVLYRNGATTDQTKTAPVGALSAGFALGEGFRGEMEEVRIWKVARTQEQIQDNLFCRLRGDLQDLVAYYTCDAEAQRQLKDHSLRGNHLAIAGPTWVLSTAPISQDAPQVRSALVGIRTPFNDTIGSRPAVQEYGDMQYNAEGKLIGVLKRCYGFVKDGQWHLFTGYKVGDLVTEWIGQAQFLPQLIGYIEGAPPVPQENLTKWRPAHLLYHAASAVEMTEAQSTAYNYSASKEYGVDVSVETSLAFGLKSDTKFGAGLGAVLLTSVEQAQMMIGIKATLDYSHSWLQDASVGIGKTTTRASKLELQGYWEKEPTEEEDGQYIPHNVGFALVQSETADIFALRLKHNQALICYQMRPNPDIPKDWNIITFPINPRYVKQGTLDGKVGCGRDPDYPQAMTYCPDLSYFKPIEAYALKDRITRQEEALKTYYQQYDVEGVESMTSGRRLEKLPKPERQNLVNTYVWTADGGLFAETQETLDVQQETMGGAYALKGMAGITARVGFYIMKVGAKFELEALVGGHLNLTVTKGWESETSFGLDVDLDAVERDILQRDGQGNLIMDGDKPKKEPGKVDAYRFMTFYLQPSTEHFQEFFNKVVDPIWLEQSSEPNAIALREARQDGTATTPPCWRVLHRLTFVSRILPEFEDSAASPLERDMRAANIESNWLLIQTLEPFVRGKTGVAFNDAVRQAIKDYLPELTGHTEDIIQYLRLYYGLLGVA